MLRMGTVQLRKAWPPEITITAASVASLYHLCSDQDSCTDSECCTKLPLSDLNDVELQISYSLAAPTQM